MKFLKAEKQPTQYYFQVWMDETKKQSDGTPGPAYVGEYAWGIQPPEGQTDTDYLASIKREIGLLVADELTGMATPAPTPAPLAGF